MIQSEAYSGVVPVYNNSLSSGAGTGISGGGGGRDGNDKDKDKDKEKDKEKDHKDRERGGASSMAGLGSEAGQSGRLDGMARNPYYNSLRVLQHDKGTPIHPSFFSLGRNFALLEQFANK